MSLDYATIKSACKLPVHFRLAILTQW